jgi:ribonuclease-3
MQTGLVALLDRFVAAETTTDADRDVLHHANHLRRLLCARNHSTSANAKLELDGKRPDHAANVAVPEYLERKVFDAKDLPPLPPIVEPHLHEAVFTHRSANLGSGNSNQALQLHLDYERLELLGDAYIELIASRALYNRFPHVDVPELCSWRERLVENSALGKFSEAYGFPDRLKHRNQWDHSTKAWHKVVADIFEAYVAALVLSDPVNGFSTAEEWLTDLWAPQLLGFKEKIIENPQAREELNKMIVVKDVKLDYRQEKPMTYDSGSIQRFFIGLYLTGWGYENEWLGSGEGQSKHQAAVAAANAAIKNSPAVKDAAQQKGKLMEVRKRALEETRAQEEAGVDEKNIAPTQKGTSDLSPMTPNTDEALGKRKSGVDEPSTTPKKKKHKKEKKGQDGQPERGDEEANVLN